ncbi:Protein FAF1 [Paramyrothecium foliicola]|nr:Protein FAF1 [Paramyrothecium foliicola]
MAVLGKRKASEQTTSAEEAEEIFRRHFEARFKPLDDEPKAASTRDDQDAPDSDEEDSEWGGLSGEEDAAAEEEAEQPVVVEVVDHSSSQTSKPAAMSKRELKAFMSSRPPDQSLLKDINPNERDATTSTPTKAVPEDAPSLLKQDLELRRLLSESHLLSALNQSSSSHASGEPKAFATGRTRKKATDMRIQALGSKTSILKQEKMPMNIRKGIAAVATARETKRRREAKENGVILEREAPKKSKRERRRDPGVDRPGIGRLSGASLKLSDRDIKSIEGTRDTFGRRGRR